MISLHMKPDCETSVTWDVVLNGETATPLGEVKIYDTQIIDFVPNGQAFDIDVIRQLARAFPGGNNDS